MVARTLVVHPQLAGGLAVRIEIILSTEEVEEAIRDYVRERKSSTPAMVESIPEFKIGFREGPEYWQGMYTQMEVVCYLDT
jgi:hypothetical protein